MGVASWICSKEHEAFLIFSMCFVPWYIHAVVWAQQQISLTNSCMITYHPSKKTSKYDEQYMQGTAGYRKDKLIRDVLLRSPTHRNTSVDQSAMTYIQQHCTDTRCCLKDQLGAIDDRDGWQEIISELRTVNGIWWRWWNVYVYIYVYMCVY